MSAGREQEIFDSVLALVSEVGYEALTMDRIAAETKSSKATLYRQWGGKPELVACAMRSMKRDDSAEIDTGSLGGDLRMLADRLAEVARRDADLMRAMEHAAGRDEVLSEALRSAMADDRIAEALDLMLARAVERGEVAAENPAGRYVQHLMVGAVRSRFILEGREVDAAYLRDFVDAVVLPVLRGGH